MTRQEWFSRELEIQSLELLLQLWCWLQEWLLHRKIKENWKKVLLLVFNQEAVPFLLFKWNTCLKHWGPETECPQALLLSHTFLHGRNPPLRWDPEYLHFLSSSGKELISPLIFKLWKEYNKFSFVCLRSFLTYWFRVNSLPYLLTYPLVVYTS